MHQVAVEVGKFEIRRRFVDDAAPLRLRRGRVGDSHGGRGEAEQQGQGEERTDHAETSGADTSAVETPAGEAAENADSCSASQRSLAIAAMQPVPAAVTAWR